jgi:hypothetical protein
MARFDRIIHGGRVLDPANDLDAEIDIAIVAGRIAAIEPEFAPSEADDWVDASGRWVLPGVIDTHVHVAVGDGTGDRSLGYRQMAEAGVTTAIDFGGTMQGIIDGVQRRGAGLSIGGLYVLYPDLSVPGDDPSTAQLQDILHIALRQGSLGFKCMGGHSPLTPDATARAIDVCNQSMAYVALHCGTKASSSNLTGLREVPELVGKGRLHVAHVNAYCRGMVRHPMDEYREAIDIISGMGEQLVSEVHMAKPNGTSGHCEGDEVADLVTRNCLLMRDYPPTRTGLRQAMEEGYASVVTERGGRAVLVERDEAVAEWEASGTQIAVSFPVGLTDIAFNLSVAKEDSGEFVIDAVATDGGYFPRNIAVTRTWAMVALGAITSLEMAVKLSWNPSRMFGLVNKGHLSPGADADITIVNAETGAPTMSLVSGEVVMLEGRSISRGGTLLVTSEGEESARNAGLGYQVVDLAQSKLYQGWG